MSFSGFFVVEENTKRIMLQRLSTRDVQQVESLIKCLIKFQLLQKLQCRRQNQSPDLTLK